jgi:GTP cyclohydrolase II
MIPDESLLRMMSHIPGMPPRRAGSAVSPAASPAASVIAVEDAASRLRAGQPVIVQDESAAVLVQAAETATADSLARLIRLGEGRASLTLTAPRGAALDLPINGHPVLSLRLTDAVDLGTVRRLIDPTRRHPPVRLEARNALPDPCTSAAITLTKVAQLLPAALTLPLAPGAARQPAALIGELAAESLVQVDAAAITGYADLAALTLRPVAEARLPLAVAENARIVGFRPADGSVEQLAIVVGAPAEHQPVLCRIHSACFTGDLLGSLRCDCGSQLQEALRLMGEAGHGVLLYLAHEGRGIGLINKLRAYQLQDQGFDTLDANRQLGFEPDERSFKAAAVMLRHLGVGRVRLLTNNPVKVERLVQEGIQVTERVPHAIASNRHNQAYLATKARRAGHWLKE